VHSTPLLLQEMWNCPYSNDSFPTYAEDIDGGASPSTDMLSEAAKSKRVTIVGGKFEQRSF
jgi:omega-amidase